MLTDLDRKIIEEFGEVVVDKRFSRLEPTGRLPRYLQEYLVSRFCSGDPNEKDIAELIEFINVRYPEPRDKDKVLHQIMTKGEYNLIDEFKVVTDLAKTTHWVRIPSLGVKASISESILDQFDNLLRSGMWGLAKLKYVTDASPKNDPTNLLMSEFTPFQVSHVNLPSFANKRRKFTISEWIDLLIRTVGLNPDVYNVDAKIMLLSRLIPLVESNCNLLELGPKATGKSYLYRNISFHTRMISGGIVSPATLFYNIALDSVGEICIRDCIAFDEIKSIQFLGASKILGKMKDYMADGFFERGPKKTSSGCSLVFLGNIEVSDELPVEDFSKVLPQFMCDAAFIDRLDGLVPGWRLPKIKQSKLNLANGPGLVTHYIAEILHELRNKHFYNKIEEHAKLTGDLTIRDERSIKKLASGMLKILSPDGDPTEEELKLSLRTGLDYRQRIADWLHKLSPGEFRKIELGYELL